MDDRTGGRERRVDVFVSYAREDRDKARRLAALLERHGWSVWWDRQIPLGRSYDDVIEAALEGAGCVVVLWTSAAVVSKWVKAEARVGSEREALVPVLFEQVRVPLEFRALESAQLWDWSDQDGDHPELAKLFERIAELVGSGGAAGETSQSGWKAAGAVPAITTAPRRDHATSSSPAPSSAPAAARGDPGATSSTTSTGSMGTVARGRRLGVPAFFLLTGVVLLAGIVGVVRWHSAREIDRNLAALASVAAGPPKAGASAAAAPPIVPAVEPPRLTVLQETTGPSEAPLDPWPDPAAGAGSPRAKRAEPKTARPTRVAPRLHPIAGADARATRKVETPAVPVTEALRGASPISGTNTASTMRVEKAATPTAEAAQPSPSHLEMRDDEKASEAFYSQRYEDAVRGYAKLYATTRNPVYLRNLARCRQKLGEWDEAIQLFRRFLEISPDLSPLRRQEVERYIREIEARQLDSR